MGERFGPGGEALVVGVVFWHVGRISSSSGDGVLEIRPGWDRFKVLKCRSGVYPVWAFGKAGEGSVSTQLSQAVLNSEQLGFWYL